MSSPVSSPSPMDGESGFSLFSPAETSYSLEDGDAPKTPLFTDDVERDVFLHHFNPDPNHLPSYQFGEGQNLNEFGSETSETLYFLASPIPPLCVLSSTQQIPPQSRLPSSLRALDGITIEDNPDLIIIDPFDSSFTAANADRITHAPLLVQTSFTEACGYSSRFPNGHLLNPSFVRAYDLGDELGSGGYGFVMTAYNRAQNREVAVKFIIKERVSEHSWTEDEVFGRLPTEILLLSLIDHENIVKCLDLFEDELYFYLIQELHGSPWKKLLDVLPSQARSLVADESSSPPLLSPSSSEDSMVDFSPTTPLQPSDLKLVQHVQIRGTETPLYHISKQEFESLSPEQLHQNEHAFQRIHCSKFSRRPSHDLFECIEQTPNKCLSEDQARYIFAQVVEAAFYLDSQGITHRDIKDENLVIDKDLKIKLIDFGSAVIADPSEPRPFYDLFFGTTAYASSEILRKQPYQAPAAEIWTLGILLSYLLTGMSPFPNEMDAIEGRIILAEIPGSRLSKACLNLMRRCLEPDPEIRADIKEVRAHRWLK